MRRSFDGTSNCNLLNSFNFMSEVFIIWLAIDYITIIQMTSYKWFMYCNKRISGESFTKFMLMPIVFTALGIFSLIWRSKFRVSSKYIPKCFSQLAQKTVILLKNVFGWDALFDFLKNITSWACLFKSRLNKIFNI